MKKTVLVDHAVIHVSQQKPAQHFHGWDSKANIHRERQTDLAYRQTASTKSDERPILGE